MKSETVTVVMLIGANIAIPENRGLKNNYYNKIYTRVSAFERFGWNWIPYYNNPKKTQYNNTDNNMGDQVIRTLIKYSELYPTCPKKKGHTHSVDEFVDSIAVITSVEYQLLLQSCRHDLPITGSNCYTEIMCYWNLKNHRNCCLRNVKIPKFICY